MIVYHPMGRRSASLMATPAKDPRTANGGRASEWFDDLGAPKMFVIDFKHGRAEVPDSVGRYLVETRQAKRTMLFLPGFMAA